MMAALFLLMSGTIAAVFFNKRRFAMILWFVTLGLCWLMFNYHITETLRINW